MRLRKSILTLVAAVSLLSIFSNSVNGDESLDTSKPVSPFVTAKKSVDDLGRYFDRLFSTELPFIGAESVWEFDFSPKFGDLRDDPGVRLPLEATYGFSETFEMHIGYTPYFANPIDSEPDWSDGYVLFGFKKRLVKFLDEKWDFAYGVDVKEPLDLIPDDYIRANYTIYRPYAVFSKRLGETERWRAYWNLNYDQVGDHVHSSNAPGNAPDSVFGLQQGIIFTPKGEWRYSVELEYATTRLDGLKDDQWIIKPGVTWFPTENRREAWIIPGDYSIGLKFGFALDYLEENKDRSDIRVGVRFRWRLKAK